MNDCIFCKIIKGEMPAQFVWQDEDLVAFADINPKAPVHILIVPKKHLESVREATDEDVTLLGKMLLAAKKIAQKQRIAGSGYKLVINNGEAAGQIVPHLHMHLLGGGVFE